MTTPHFQYQMPEEALAAIEAQLTIAPTERVTLEMASGRILAAEVAADRPSPACDVSAMDGYGARMADFAQGLLDVDGETCPGQAPEPLAEVQARRIFTGAPVPAEVEAIVRREDTMETTGAIELRVPITAIRPGQHIRRQGENGPSGEVMLEPGRLLDGAAVASLATVGTTEVAVYCRRKVAILVTGDELLPAEATPSPWQLRDSNGPSLRALLAPYPWIHVISVERVIDEKSALEAAIARAFDAADAVLLSGGVSMGDYDYVPAVLEDCGARNIFHKLPIRPGKPLLAAIGPKKQLVFGLPGNPVSALVCARRFALPALLHQAGGVAPKPQTVRILHPDDATLPLHWFRLVQETGAGEVSLVAHRGSGDVVGLGRSSGFIEQPRDEKLGAEALYYAWSHL